MVCSQQIECARVVCRAAKVAIGSGTTQHDGSGRQSPEVKTRCTGESDLAPFYSHRRKDRSGSLPATTRRCCSEWECATPGASADCSTGNRRRPSATGQHGRGSLWTVESGYAEPATRSGPESAFRAIREWWRQRRRPSPISEHGNAHAHADIGPRSNIGIPTRVLVYLLRKHAWSGRSGRAAEAAHVAFL